MSLTITDVTRERVTLTNYLTGLKATARATAAGRRMFQPVALITEDEIEELIDAARCNGLTAQVMLQDIRREYFE